jgi:DHA1 family tetracycline resistance protein-like MFS transporter
MNTKRLLPIFLIVFVDLLGFGLILPLLPYYAEAFGASAFVTGLLVSSYAAAQLIGAPVLGRLSDRYGRKPMLMISLFGSFAGFVLLAVAGPVGKLAAEFLPFRTGAITLGVIFFSRILDGITGGNISIAQAYISDITDAKNRAKGLGLIGAAFGLGFIFGPATGGALSRWGYGVPAAVAAGLSLFNLLMVAFRLPESLTPEKRALMIRQPQGGFTLKALWRALNRPLVGPLLHTRFFFGLAFSIFQTVFALYVLARFQLSSAQTGFILAYVGVLSVLVQGVMVGRLTRRFEESTLIYAAVVLMGVSLLGWAAAPSVPVLLAVLAPTAVAGGVLNTVINSALTKVVRPVEIGGTLGLSSALESLTRVIAPALGGALLQTWGPAAPGLFAAILCLPLALFLRRRIVAAPQLPAEVEPTVAGNC